MSAEDPSALRTTRASPSLQRNGHEDRAGSVSRTEERRGSSRQTHQDHPNTGPATRGAKSPLPFFDCADVDSEYNQTIRLNHSHREQPMVLHGPGSGSMNGPLQAFSGGLQYGEAPSSSKQSLNMHATSTHQKFDQSPLHMADLSGHNTERHSSSPLTSPSLGSRSPAMDNHHSLDYSEQNGYSATPPHFEEGIYSSASGHYPRLQKKRHKVRQQSETDPGTSSLGNELIPSLSRAERMAALERRMVANGLTVASRSRASPGRKPLRHAGTHVGAVQMNDCSSTSGSESSESEVETSRGRCSSPLMVGNPVGANSTSPLPRNKYSFGSLQLDDEADEDEYQALSDEDGGQFFSC